MKLLPFLLNSLKNNRSTKSYKIKNQSLISLVVLLLEVLLYADTLPAYSLPS